jgi:hypothetical protein
MRPCDNDLGVLFLMKFIAVAIIELHLLYFGFSDRLIAWVD